MPTKSSSREGRILITGAAGRIGRRVAVSLSEEGLSLRLTDRTPFPGDIPVQCEFVVADLSDEVQVLNAARDCATILHLAGIPNERQGADALIDANIRGTFHVFEAARRAGARVVFASSNHVVGFHERPRSPNDRLAADCSYRPDSLYGLSKIYGEQLGRLYWDKYGVESVHIRIGSYADAPRDARSLAVWISPADFSALCLKAIRALWTGWAVIWGTSDNPASFWGQDDREVIGWQPYDTAETWRDEVGGLRSDDPIVERFQGGVYCRQELPS